MKITKSLLIAVTAAVVSADDNVCISDTKTYTVKVNLFAGELGYYSFDECPDLVSPTIGMQVGETYTFSQAHRTNYYHPIGFSYYADGAHDDQDELEPGIAPYDTTSDCADTLSCPAPIYQLNGESLGTYSNLVGEETQGEDNFGLDVYEPLFFRPLAEWAGFGDFSVKLRFNNEDFTKDLFYFCHIHQFMTGRIKLLNATDESLVQPVERLPELPYKYDEPGDFDKECGTFGLDAFQLPNDQCPERFVCNVPKDNDALSLYSSCIEAMDCHMLAGMTTNVESQSETALFIHQMVPHHQNAVNMAKALLKTGLLVCDDLTSETDDCVMENILMEIVNSQNFQIQTMYGILEEMGYPKTDDCEVLIESEAQEGGAPVAPPGSTPTEQSPSAAVACGVQNVVVVAGSVLFATMLL